MSRPLKPGQACFELPMDREPARTSICPVAGPDPEPSGLNGHVADQSVASEMKIDERDRALISAPCRDGPAIRAGIVITALIASFGFAWIVTGPPVWPSGLSSLSLFDSRAGSSPEPSLSSAARVPDSKKGDRLRIGRTGASTLPDETADAPDGPRLSSPALGSAHKRPPGPAPRPAPGPASASNHSPVPHQRTGSIGPTAADVQPRAKLTATPETRPTTIEGWTVREVRNGTAILEGPNGVWRATTGETVPGVGRVDSVVRWGDRWIVATSRGLITTQ